LEISYKEVYYEQQSRIPSGFPVNSSDTLLLQSTNSETDVRTPSARGQATVECGDKRLVQLKENL
jgi:hypothetical protein